MKPIILCVDDEKTVLETLERQISQTLGEFFEIEIAESGLEALELVKELKDDNRELAIVISDMIMPGMKGDELLTHLHRLEPDTPKILLTGQADFQSVINVINRAKLYRYIPKPWEPNDLVLTVEQAARSFQQQQEIVQSRAYNQLLEALNRSVQQISGHIKTPDLVRAFLGTAYEFSKAGAIWLLLDPKGVAGPNEFNPSKAYLDYLAQGRPTTSGLAPEEVWEKAHALGCRNEFTPDALAVPVQRGKRFHGYAYFQQGPGFVDSHAKTMWMLASQLAISLETASLYGQVEAQHNDIVDSIVYAQRIQQSIMPAPDSLSGLLQHYFVFFRPRDIVSGDFYWWAETGGKLVVAAIDCTGHGVPGAFMSLIGSNLLHQLVVEAGLASAADILLGLHHGVRQALGQNSAMNDSKRKDGMDVGLAVLDFATRSLEFAGARRPMFLWQNDDFRAFAGTKRSINENDDVSLAELFDSEKITWNSGDRLFLFTDGFQDQFGGPFQRKLMSKGFRNMLHSHQYLPMAEQGNAMGNFLQHWMGNLNQTDDILVIGIELP